MLYVYETFKTHVTTLNNSNENLSNSTPEIGAETYTSGLIHEALKLSIRIKLFLKLENVLVVSWKK